MTMARIWREFPVKPERGAADGLARYPSADRIGFAQLTTMAFEGTDLRPLRDQLMSKLAAGTADAGEGLDLSLITQLLGDKPGGNRNSGGSARLPPAIPVAMFVGKAGFAGSGARGRDGHGRQHADRVPAGEFRDRAADALRRGGVELPAPLPEHDVAIVIASDRRNVWRRCARSMRVASRWPRPLLNPPQLVGHLDRDKLHGLLRGIAGLDIPATDA